MAFFDNINGLNGLVAGAAGGSDARLVLPPPLQFLGFPRIRNGEV